jgi:hypothetical protein
VLFIAGRSIRLGRNGMPDSGGLWSVETRPT